MKVHNYYSKKVELSEEELESLKKVIQILCKLETMMRNTGEKLVFERHDTEGWYYDADSLYKLRGQIEEFAYTSSISLTNESVIEE